LNIDRRRASKAAGGFLMILKKLIVLAGIAGTLGVAAPAFADWHRPTVVVRPGPVYRPIARPYVGVGVYAPGYYNPGYYNPGYYNSGYYGPSYGYRVQPAYRYRTWHHPRYYRHW
jgi:hypothetical protein